jgi:hypothetical protein
MGYLDDYNARIGKCEYCKFHNVTGSQRCVECYGSAFVDKLCLYEFIRKQVTENAVDKFNNTNKGKQLLEELEKCKQAYYNAEDEYDKEKNDFIQSELKRIDNTINTL